MTATTDSPILGTRRLGRATLARQLLLEPATVDVTAAVGSIGGLQAQEPASPYIALWARLARFDRTSLDDALAKRKLVKGTLMRRTVHMVPAADYRALWTATQARLTGVRRADRRDVPDARLLRELRRFGKEFASEPRSLPELRDGLGDRAGRSSDELLWWLRWVHPLIHVPAEVPWSFGRRPLLVDADAWLPPGEWPDPASAVEHLVRRYLAAFGPASVADIARWAGIPVAAVRPGVDAIEATGDLRTYSADSGRTLIDLVDAPLPDVGIEAPVRLLPMWDSTVLAHDDRTRIIGNDDRARVIARNGDTLATVLVDGVVAGRWWPVVDHGRTRIQLEPFGRLARADRIELDELADDLARFVEPLEPALYARYRRWRKDDA